MAHHRATGQLVLHALSLVHDLPIGVANERGGDAVNAGKVKPPDEHREGDRDRLRQLVRVGPEVPDAPAIDAVEARPEAAPQERVGQPSPWRARLHGADERGIEPIFVVEIFLSMGEVGE
ncbi:MAG TPA: hypothetical protein VF469_21575 [Kofleriaceae bacterium]